MMVLEYMQLALNSSGR